MRPIEMCRIMDEVVLKIEHNTNLSSLFIEQLKFENKQMKGRWERVCLEKHIYTLGDLAQFYRKNGMARLRCIRAVGEKSIEALIVALRNA